ncbi:YciI family protein [Sphingomonas sp. CJ99]
MRIWKGVALAALIMAGIGVARAEPFTLTVYETADQLALRSDAGEPGRAYWGSYAAAGDAMAKSGIMRGGAALVPVAAPKSGELTLSGYFIIDVKDRAEAEAWALKLPAARTGRVDVRAHVPMPGMN